MPVKHCPRDATPLIASTAHGHRIDRCPACAGCFIAQGIFRDKLNPPLPALASLPRGSLICPACGPHAGKLLIVRHEGIEIDLCARCGGAWLDAGELDTLRFTGNKGDLSDLGDAIEFVVQILGGLFDG